MIAEQIENFIIGLIEKTQKGSLKWKAVEKINAWKEMKEQIQQTIRDDLKDYFIEDSKSYYINKSNGYVMVLNVRYGNAPVFSDALDKYILIVKINDDLLPENLSKHDWQGYKNLLQELTDEIEFQRNEEYIMPDCMYEFFGKVLGEDENGRIIDK